MSRMHRQLPHTVLLVVKNEEASLPKCVASLASSEWVILLDSQTRERTNEMATLNGADIVQCLSNLIASIRYTNVKHPIGALRMSVSPSARIVDANVRLWTFGQRLHLKYRSCSVGGGANILN